MHGPGQEEELPSNAPALEARNLSMYEASLAIILAAQYQCPSRIPSHRRHGRSAEPAAIDELSEARAQGMSPGTAATRQWRKG